MKVAIIVSVITADFNTAFPYARRSNRVNVIGTGEDEQQDPRRYCPRCSFELYYIEEDKIHVCGKCGWGLPNKYLGKYQEEEQNKKKNKKEGGVVTTTTKEGGGDMFIIPKIIERGKKRNEKDPFEYLKKDDAYLQKLGYILKEDVIEFSDDGSTVSSEELRRQNNKNLRGKRIS